MFKAIAKQIKEGDRVIWIVFSMLVLISLVAIFSSTSTMAIKLGVSRMDIFFSHIKIVLAGVGIVLALNAISSVKFFRVMSQTGFLVSLFLLLCLVLSIRVGSFISVNSKNNAVRAITIGHFNLAVYEVVKVAMVMYIAWAVHQYESGSFKLADRLGTKWPGAFGWMKSPRALRWLYIFGPMLTVTGLTLMGSTGSAILILATMTVTAIVGGIKWKHVMELALASIICAFIAVSVHVLSSGELIARMSTFFTRMNIELPYPDQEARAKQHEAVKVKSAKLEDLTPGTKEFKKAIDPKRQTGSAKVAVVEGGRKIFGKGPGKSTQKYICPIMFEDFMFSFLIEEYGLVLGAGVILILYLSLFARGMILVHNSSYRYAKACIGGLVFLITGQAIFHILVNCDIGLVSGQTLPLISHGRCSFLCFCVAFGVLLSISVQVNKKVKKMQEEEAEKMKMEIEQENESNN